MVGQMDSKNSKVTFVTKIIFWELGGQVTGIGQSSPGSLRKVLTDRWTSLDRSSDAITSKNKQNWLF